MAKGSIYQQRKKAALRKKAFLLYTDSDLGLGLREVGKIIGKSHEWVRDAVQRMEAKEKKKKLSTDNS